MTRLQNPKMNRSWRGHRFYSCQEIYDHSQHKVLWVLKKMCMGLEEGCKSLEEANVGGGGGASICL